jgi:uncharacterized membrane protein
MIALGDLPGGEARSEARGVSADGSVIVGRAFSDAGSEAVIWTESGGLQRLSDVLTTGGIDLTGWTLIEAFAVSADGRTIAGVAGNSENRQEAFIARIPEPSASLLGVGTLVAFILRRVRGRDVGLR